MEMSGYLHFLATMPMGKNQGTPWNRRLGVSQSPSGHHGENKTLLPALWWAH